MTHEILIAGGIIIIIVSLISIKKRIEEEKNIYEEIIKLHKEIKDYAKITEKILEDLEDLIDGSFYKLNETLDMQRDTKSFEEISFETDDEKNDDVMLDIERENEERKGDDIVSEIINLKSCGYSVAEIAKKLNKGKREVEIILKMYRKK